MRRWLTEWRAQRDGRTQVKPLGILRDTSASEQLQKISNVNLIDLGADWAVVQVNTRGGEFTTPNTSLSARSAWLVCRSSQCRLLGRPHMKETAHFVFHYYALDAKAVAEAAVKLDAVYPALLATYPLNLADDDKREVWVSPEYPSRRTSSSERAVIKIASPSIKLAPTTLREGDILAQAVLIELLKTLTVQSFAHQFPGDLDAIQAENRVSALLASLELWHLWHTELLLATLRKPTIQWLYSNGRTTACCPILTQICALSISYGKQHPMQFRFPCFVAIRKR